MDPDPAQIEQAKHHGADRIELYTGPFADTVLEFGADSAQTLGSFERYQDAARYASQLGMGVNAGHDLDLNNLPVFCRIAEVSEVSIGHALICDALENGLFETVRAYLTLTE